MLFLLILYVGNKASLIIRHKIYRSLEMRYCGVHLYVPFGNRLEMATNHCRLREIHAQNDKSRTNIRTISDFTVITIQYMILTT